MRTGATAALLALLASSSLPLRADAASPVLAGGGSLGADVLEDSTGITLVPDNVTDFLSDKASDSDGDAVGFAVIGADPGFEFYEGQWWDFRRPGDLTPTNALLIAPTTSIRYIPPKEFNGVAKFTFKARW
jgi:hypothetical protein